jgi:ribosomal protein L24E
MTPARAKHSKTCALCGRKIYQGEGTIYQGNLVHRVCKNRLT